MKILRTLTKSDHECTVLGTLTKSNNDGESSSQSCLGLEQYTIGKSVYRFHPQLYGHQLDLCMKR